MRECTSCGGEVADVFRYCPWCAAPQRRKLVEFFRSDPRFADDRAKALRVSRYLDQHHARFSIWRDGEAVGAVSLDDAETDRLTRFLGAPRPARAPLFGYLRGGVRRRSRSTGEREPAP